MNGFIKTVNGKYSQLINIKYIKSIDYRAGCIEAEMHDNDFYILFRPEISLEDSKEFMNKMLDRIFYLLSDCEYDNVFIDIDVIREDTANELEEESRQDRC